MPEQQMRSRICPFVCVGNIMLDESVDRCVRSVVKSVIKSLFDFGDR